MLFLVGRILLAYIVYEVHRFRKVMVAFIMLFVKAPFEVLLSMFKFMVRGFCFAIYYVF